jgi:hypothetical protein
VTLTNAGATAATGLSVTDNLPSGTGVDWSIDAANSDAGWSVAGSPPNESLVYSPTTLDGNASTHVHVVSGTTNGSCGTYNNTASFTTGNDGSGQASDSVMVANCQQQRTAQITGARVSCSQFAGGTAPTLDRLDYTVRSGKINQVSPGTFLYWVKVTVGTSGDHSQTITQSAVPMFKLFGLAKGSAVYNAGCGSLFKPPFVANGNNSAFTVSWNGAAGDYYIALKLDSSSVRGEQAPPTPIHYEYAATGVAASTAGIDLAPR